MLDSNRITLAISILATAATALGCESDSGKNDSGAQNVATPTISVVPGPTLPGQIRINEIMANPSGIADRDGEWFELANPGTSELNLRDCVVSDASTVNFVIDSEFIVGGSELKVLASGSNPGFMPDYDYGTSGLSLNNSNETLALTCHGVTIDQFAYAASSPGQSAALSANGNLKWCADTVNVYANGDKGTPGMTNIDCP